MEVFTPSLLTLVKILDDGPVRRKVEEIVTTMHPMVEQAYVDCRMFLGDEHPIVKQIKKEMENGRRSSDTSLNLQCQCDRKMYAMSFIGCTHSYDPLACFIDIDEHYHVSAIIKADKTLCWEGSNPKLGKSIRFTNKPSGHSRQTRLFIISQLPAPATFWELVASCTSLEMFEEILKEPSVRIMILAYEMTILESSSEYKFKPAQTQNTTIKAKSTS